MRRIGLLILLSALLIPGVAAASSNGSLTSAEYAQLTAARTKLKSVNLKTAHGFKTALWDCETIQEVSSLLTQERSDCIAQLQMGVFSAVMQAEGRSCIAYKAVARRLKCLMPYYRKLDAAVSRFYHAESSIHRIATSRGFTAACANLLADPPRVITEEKRMLDIVGSILTAMKTDKALSFEEYSGEFITAAAQIQAGQNANKGQLSICVRH